MRVLIADRQSLFLNGLRHLLRGQIGAVSVCEARHLDEALDLLAEARFDMAFFDPDLPGCRGPTGLGFIKASYPDLKIIVLSHDADEDCTMVTLEAGLDGCLPRGSTADEVAEAVQLIRSGHVFIPQSVLNRSLKRQAQSPAAQATSRPHDCIDAQRRAVTARQHDVLKCLVRGLSNNEISRELQIANGTVKSHLGTLFDMFGVRNRTELAIRARAEFPELS